MFAKVIELSGIGGKYYAIEVSDGGEIFHLKMTDRQYSSLCHKLTGDPEKHNDVRMFGYFLDMSQALNSIPAIDLTLIGDNKA